MGCPVYLEHHFAHDRQPDPGPQTRRHCLFRLRNGRRPRGIRRDHLWLCSPGAPVVPGASPTAAVASMTLLTIAIPTFNRPAPLSRTLAALLPQLGAEAELV